MMQSPPSTESRIRGCLYGALLGDVLGAPFELAYQNDLNDVKEFIDNVLTNGMTAIWELFSLRCGVEAHRRQ